MKVALFIALSSGSSHVNSPAVSQLSVTGQKNPGSALYEPPAHTIALPTIGVPVGGWGVTVGRPILVREIVKDGYRRGGGFAGMTTYTEPEKYTSV